jgi:N-acetylneuraminate synthase
MSKTIVIAEAGVNHNGNIQLAKQLIDVAKDCGADYVKFQIWVTDEILAPDAPKAQYQKDNDGDDSQYEMAKRLELTFDQYVELKKHCDNVGIKFLATPDDFTSLDFITDTLGLDLIKIGSGEITNIPFLKRIGSKKRNVILSTGMASLGEVEKAYNSLVSSGALSVALLHCTSSYPAPFNTLNLRAIRTLRKAFQTTVGYSDHTIGSEASVAAVALGAEIIEKHFTIDKNLPGPDHIASMEPMELKEMINQIRNIEQALGSGVKQIQSIEVETKKVVTKGVYIKKSIKKGSIISLDNVLFMRPVDEISANFFEQIEGKRISRDISDGEPLKWKDIVFE